MPPDDNSDMAQSRQSEDAGRPNAPSSAAIRDTEEKPGLLRWLLETILMVALAFALAQGIKAFVVQPFVIPTGSMEPTIMTGDRVLAEKISYRFHDPRQGDIVVFDDPTGRHPQLIKRVVAISGQTVDIKDGTVYVDGHPLQEPYLHGLSTEPGGDSIEYPFTVPDGDIWVMGDNRPNSGDSRYLGPQPVSSVKGRAFAVYWPLSRIGGL
ncbi:MAG: signal peptidase I [Coriobacteriia bacterium]|nr:signal peptidase I [Coriobacteriia bacterium]